MLSYIELENDYIVRNTLLEGIESEKGIIPFSSFYYSYDENE